MADQNDVWKDNSVQFPRLLAEIRAVGLTRKQYTALEESMALTVPYIDEILNRAEEEWETLKKELHDKDKVSVRK